MTACGAGIAGRDRGASLELLDVAAEPAWREVCPDDPMAGAAYWLWIVYAAGGVAELGRDAEYSAARAAGRKALARAAATGERRYKAGRKAPSPAAARRALTPGESPGANPGEAERLPERMDVLTGLWTRSVYATARGSAAMRGRR